jgi:hypothetical protein
MWRRVDLVWTGFSEERIASIFRVENSANEEPAWAGGCRLLSGFICVILKVDCKCIGENMIWKRLKFVAGSQSASNAQLWVVIMYFCSLFYYIVSI